MGKKTEQRFKEFKALRAKRVTVGEAAEMLGVHKVTANRYERMFKAEGYTTKMITSEQRFKGYTALRAKGIAIGEIAKILNICRGTASRYEKRRKAEGFPQRIANAEKWFDNLLESGASATDIVKASDAIVKLRSAYFKYS